MLLTISRQVLRPVGLALMAVVLTLPSITVVGADDTAEKNEFFETQIRPLLVNHCLECHGAEKAESDLRLDSRDAILAGGSSGTAGAVAGDPASSLIVQAVRHSGDYEMPPNKKLSQQETSDLASWVAMSLPWPENAVAIAKLGIGERIKNHRQNHWSFQPVVAPKIPASEAPAPSNVDRFIIANLETNGLTRSPRADRRTLIRRATFDLTGLPPTYDQVVSFVNDDSPDAYAKLVGHLLDSPQYGERWARHWLDVARYSDTSGYALGNSDNRYPFAFTYRDYVIDAFNRDLPYDQFIREQLAADYLDVPADKKTLAALGFITVGRKFLGRNETVDDQVDVVTRGLMGLTVACARCHDHKYDAIPTEDYYSLYSIFANNYIPDELPILGSDQERSRFESYFQELTKLKQAIESFRNRKHEELLLHVENHFSDYLARVMIPDQEPLVTQQPFTELEGAGVNERILHHWRTHLAQHHNNPTLIKPTLELLAIPDEDFESNAARLIEHWSAQPNETIVNPLYLEKLKSNAPQQKIELARIMGELFSETLEQWKSAGAKQPPAEQFSGPRQEVAKILFGNQSPTMISVQHLDPFLTLPDQKEIEILRANVNKHNSAAPEGLARAMVLRDQENLAEQHVMLRGQEHQHGEIVPRRFVALLTEPATDGTRPRPAFKNKSGRLELAEKIANRDNPLTARVFVNRVWMHHFSRPLVDTPSDFGIRCEQPVQHELLDFLAADFMEQGWSIKHLHRTMMLSDTYCQTSYDRPECSELDPENRLIWKMNRRRLEFEPLRDSMLAVSNTLDRKLHGKPIDLFERPPSNRRTIYGFIDRQDLPGLFRVFDLANPDQSAARRTRTTVPQQSLYMLNSTFVIQQSRALIETIPEFDETSVEGRIIALYRILYQRDPDGEEIETGVQYIQTATPMSGKKNLGVWERYAQLLICTNEFEFID